MFFETEYLVKYSTLNCITYYESYNKPPKFYLYKNVVETIKILNQFFHKFGVKPNSTIGLVFGHSPVIIPLILSILTNKNSFYFISEVNLIQIVKDCQPKGIQYILVSGNNLELDITNSQAVKGDLINVFGNNIHLLEIVTIEKKTSSNICYSVTTSGSTGQAKYIQVPFQCIMPNIESLILKFELNSNDTLVLVSPTTFDPFIVDIFMGLTVGANLIFLDNKLRLSHSNLALFLFSKTHCEATFMQCTPSYFKLFSIEQITNTILSESSSLKTLVLGGEKFPTQTELKSWRTQKKIYNIYGITEVSCWATIDKWDAHQEISLGDPIDDTTLLAVQSGELYIGSTTRICTVNKEPNEIICANKLIMRPTGDLVELRKGRYYFRGRKDDSIKRFGIKLNLSETENMILHLIPKILQLKLIFYNQTDLVLFYRDKDSNLITSEEIQLIIIKSLKPYEIPSEIIKIDKFPLSHNGKLSKKMLVDLYCSKNIEYRTNTNVCDLFISQIRKMCDSSLYENKRIKIDLMGFPFFAHGGNSFLALNIVNTIETRLGISTPKLLTLLLDESKTINDCLIYLNHFDNQAGKPVQISTYTESITSSIISKIDLQKCIDSKPSINIFNNKTIISIGSHSGIILNIEVPHNKIISKLKLPDRIESEIVKFNDHFGIVGCYNGHLYCYNIFNGEIEWSFNSNGMIKSRPLIVNNLILFGNYNLEFNFYCIHGLNGKLNYRKMIGTKSILSNPIRYYDNFCIICTLDGTCEVFNYLDGLIKWCVKLNSPIFSTPAIIDRRHILISEVEGIVHCLEENGNEIWNFKTDSNIFSSFEIKTLTESIIHIYFGCYNKKLYCLEYNTSNRTLALTRESMKLASPIYSTPELINLDKRFYILVAATVGIIYLLDTENFEIAHKLALPGEVFSTPVIICSNGDAINECNIAIGSRDNYMYLINFKNLSTK